jgi:hypothetical protein
VAFLETQFLDTNLAGGEFVLAQDDGEGDTALFGGLELLGELGLDLVGEFSLHGNGQLSFCFYCAEGIAEEAYLDSGVPEFLAYIHTLLEHTSETLSSKGHDKDIDFAAAQCLGALFPLESGLGDGEDTVDSE